MSAKYTEAEDRLIYAHVEKWNKMNPKSKRESVSWKEFNFNHPMINPCRNTAGIKARYYSFLKPNLEGSKPRSAKRGAKQRQKEAAQVSTPYASLGSSPDSGSSGYSTGASSQSMAYMSSGSRVTGPGRIGSTGMSDVGTYSNSQQGISCGLCNRSFAEYEDLAMHECRQQPMPNPAQAPPLPDHRHTQQQQRGAHPPSMPYGASSLLNEFSADDVMLQIGQQLGAPAGLDAVLGPHLDSYGSDLTALSDDMVYGDLGMIGGARAASVPPSFYIDSRDPKNDRGRGSGSSWSSERSQINELAEPQTSWGQRRGLLPGEFGELSRGDDGFANATANAQAPNANANPGMKPRKLAQRRQSDPGRAPVKENSLRERERRLALKTGMESLKGAISDVPLPDKVDMQDVVEGAIETIVSLRTTEADTLRHIKHANAVRNALHAGQNLPRRPMSPSPADKRTAAMEMPKPTPKRKKRDFTKVEDNIIMAYVEGWLAKRTNYGVQPITSNISPECWMQLDLSSLGLAQARTVEGVRTRYIKGLAKGHQAAMAQRWKAAQRPQQQLAPQHHHYPPQQQYPPPQQHLGQVLHSMPNTSYSPGQSVSMLGMPQHIGGATLQATYPTAHGGAYALGSALTHPLTSYRRGKGKGRPESDEESDDDVTRKDDGDDDAFVHADSDNDRLYFIYPALEDETPQQIAKKFKTSLQDLLSMNKRFQGIRGSSKLQMGTTISVPATEDMPPVADDPYGYERKPPGRAFKRTKAPPPQRLAEYEDEYEDEDEDEDEDGSVSSLVSTPRRQSLHTPRRRRGSSQHVANPKSPATPVPKSDSKKRARGGSVTRHPSIATPGGSELDPAQFVCVCGKNCVVTFASNDKLNRSGSSRTLSDHQIHCKVHRQEEKKAATEAARLKREKTNTPKKRRHSTSTALESPRPYNSANRNPGKSPRATLQPKQRSASMSIVPTSGTLHIPGNLHSVKGSGTPPRLAPSPKQHVATVIITSPGNMGATGMVRNPGKVPRSVPLPNQHMPISNSSSKPMRAANPSKIKDPLRQKRALAEAYTDEEDSAIVRHVEEWLVNHPEEIGVTMECWRQFDFGRDFIDTTRHAEGMRTRYAKYLKYRVGHVTFLEVRTDNPASLQLVDMYSEPPFGQYHSVPRRPEPVNPGKPVSAVIKSVKPTKLAKAAKASKPGETKKTPKSKRKKQSYSCTECGQAFDLASELKVHLKKQHAATVAPKDGRKPRAKKDKAGAQPKRRNSKQTGPATGSPPGSMYQGQQQQQQQQQQKQRRRQYAHAPQAQVQHAYAEPTLARNRVLPMTGGFNQAHAPTPDPYPTEDPDPTEDPYSIMRMILTDLDSIGPEDGDGMMIPTQVGMFQDGAMQQQRQRQQPSQQMRTGGAQGGMQQQQQGQMQQIRPHNPAMMPSGVGSSMVSAPPPGVSLYSSMDTLPAWSPSAQDHPSSSQW